MNELPQGWETVTLGDLLDHFQYGLTAKADHNASGVRFLRITDIEKGRICWEQVPGIVEEIEVSKYLLSDGDFVFARSGSVEKACRIENPPHAVFASYLIRGVPLIPECADWLAYFIRSNEYLEQIHERAVGIGLSNVNAKKFATITIPLSSLAEQHRIVAKLDALFARTRQAREELENVPALIEHYRQAILAAAFRGELTADWRAKHQPPQVHANISGIDGRTGQLPGIPDVWGWASIDSISQVSGGLTKNAQRRELKQKVPYLRVANVYANELRLDEVKEIGCTDSELAKTQLQQGDLLVVEGNGSIEQIGRVAIWDGSITPCSHQNHIIRVRPNEQVISPYILFWMISPLGRQYIERVASSSSGLHTLSISKVSGLAIPVCSIDEQKEVVRHIEEAFTWLDTVLEEATSAMRLFDHLEQATLAKAFRGELVPQDPNDEPVSILLERIREARAEQTNGSQRKKRK